MADFFQVVDGWLDSPELRKGGLCMECRFVVADDKRCELCGAGQVASWSVLRRPSHFLRQLCGAQVGWKGANDVFMTVGGIATAGAALLTLTKIIHPPILFVVMLVNSADTFRRARVRRRLKGQPLAVPVEVELDDDYAPHPGVIVDGACGVDESLVSAWRVVGSDVAGVVARHGSVRELIVQLDDGRRVRVPAGPAHVFAADEAWTLLDERRLNEYMDTQLRLSLARASVGARVLLQADLEALPEAPMGYRDAPGPSHRVVGVPTLRLLSGEAVP